MTRKEKQGYIFRGPEFSVLIKYSDRSRDGKIIKFIPRKGEPFELSTEAFVSLLAKHVNFNHIAPAMIHNKTIDMVQVTRNIVLKVNRDIKEGEVISIPFTHMHPLDFAIAEEALGVAHISPEVKSINEKAFEKARKRVTQKTEDFAKEQWSQFIKEIEKSGQESS